MTRRAQTIRLGSPLTVALASLLLLGCAPLPPPRPFSGRLPAFQEGSRFAVVGDLQRTSVLEFWREQNDAERSLIVGSIAASRPAFVAMLGDLVFDGGSAKEWSAFDAITGPLRDAGVPVFSALGNHEYWGGPAGPSHLFARLPHLKERHWYTIAYGPLRLVVLDSNIDELDEPSWAEEIRWYEAALTDLDRDNDVRGVIVLLHHPPYTNSTVTGDEAHVSRFIVPPFARAHKTLALLSGHVHSYERFLRSGKMFVVTGGGGGPRAELQTGSERRHPDDLFAGPSLRAFTFVLFTVKNCGLVAEVMGLAKGGTSVSSIDRFPLPFSP